MDAIPLFKQDGSPTGIFACGICGQVYTKNDIGAEKCCQKGTCSDCGCETDKYYITLCFPCREKREMDKAEKLEDWSGPVVYNDHYYESIDDMMDCHEEENLPEFVWVAETENIPKIDATDILERLCEDLYEDAYDNLEGVKEFEAAVEAFNKANEGNTYWIESNKRATKVPKP